MGVAEVDLRARVSRAQVLEALVEILGAPATRFSEDFGCTGSQLGLEVLPRARGFLTGVHLSWPHEEFGDWIPEARLAAMLAHRFNTDAVIPNVEIPAAASLPREFVLIKPDGSAFATDLTSSGIFDDEEELLPIETLENMLPIAGLSF